MPPFWISIGALSLLQAAVVALCGRWEPPRVNWMRSRLWAIAPPASVVGFVLVGQFDGAGEGHVLTYVALVCVPLLALLALGWLMRGARVLYTPAAAGLFALAWADRGGFAGEAAATLLIALSCVALGVLIASVTPPRWLALGILAMAASDVALVVSELLEAPNEVLNVARPVARLPQLQREVFGSAVMGYGDLFIAGAFGGLLAASSGPRDQWRGALATAVIALAMNLLFFFVQDLPATAPIALALLLVRPGLLVGRGDRAARRPWPSLQPLGLRARRESRT